MRIVILTGAIALSVLASGPALTQTPPAKPALPEAFRAYLADVPPALSYLSPVAPKGSVRATSDEAYLAAASSRKSDPFYALGQSDAGKGAVLHFACTVGTDLTGHSPALVKMLSKVRTDVLNRAKIEAPAGQSLRTLTPQQQAGTCMAQDTTKTVSPDQPSVQAAWGWLMGLMFSEMAPEKTTAFMKRGRVFGSGAAMCGVATPSAVTAGRELASVLYADLKADPGFEADFVAAKAETLANIKTGAPPEGCAAEAALMATAID